MMAEISCMSSSPTQFIRPQVQQNETETQRYQQCQNLEEFQLSTTMFNQYSAKGSSIGKVGCKSSANTPNNWLIEYVNPKLLKPLSIDCRQTTPITLPPSVREEPPGLLRIFKPFDGRSQIRNEPIDWFLTCYRIPIDVHFDYTGSTGGCYQTTKSFVEAFYSTVALTTDGGTQPLCIMVCIPITSKVSWSLTLNPYEVQGWWQK